MKGTVLTKQSQMNRESQGGSIGIPHLAKNERDMGHPSFGREPEAEQCKLLRVE